MALSPNTDRGPASSTAGPWGSGSQTVTPKSSSTTTKTGGSGGGNFGGGSGGGASPKGPGASQAAAKASSANATKSSPSTTKTGSGNIGSKGGGASTQKPGAGGTGLARAGITSGLRSFTQASEMAANRSSAMNNVSSGNSKPQAGVGQGFISKQTQELKGPTAGRGTTVPTSPPKAPTAGRGIVNPTRPTVASGNSYTNPKGVPESVKNALAAKGFNPDGTRMQKGIVADKYGAPIGPQKPGLISRNPYDKTKEVQALRNPAPMPAPQVNNPLAGIMDAFAPPAPLPGIIPGLSFNSEPFKAPGLTYSEPPGSPMAPYVSGDAAMRNAISQPLKAPDYGGQFIESLIGSGLDSAQNAARLGVSAPAQPKIADRIMPSAPSMPARPPDLRASAPENNYQVQRGDTLGKIAAKLGTTVNELVRANGITNPNAIKPGQQLKMPGSDPEMATDRFGIVRFSNIGNPNIVQSINSVGTDITTPQLERYGNVGGEMVGTLGNRGVRQQAAPAMPPADSSEPVAPSPPSQGDNPPPSQDDTTPQGVREHYNRYQYEKDRLKGELMGGIKSVPGRVAQAIKDGDFRNPDGRGNFPADRSNFGQLPEPAQQPQQRSGTTDMNALLEQLLLVLSQQQGITSGNKSQMDLVYNTFV